MGAWNIDQGVDEEIARIDESIRRKTLATFILNRILDSVYKLVIYLACLKYLMN